MADRLKLKRTAHRIAIELYSKLEAREVTKIGIDEVRAAIVPEAAHLDLDAVEQEQLEIMTLRALIEKVG